MNNPMFYVFMQYAASFVNGRPRYSNKDSRYLHKIHINRCGSVAVSITSADIAPLYGLRKWRQINRNYLTAFAIIYVKVCIHR